MNFKETFKNELFLIYDNNKNILLELRRETTNSVKVFGIWAHVERRDGTQELHNLLDETIIDDGFQNIKYLKDHNLLVLEYGPEDIVYLCSLNCKKTCHFKESVLGDNGNHKITLLSGEEMTFAPLMEAF